MMGGSYRINAGDSKCKQNFIEASTGFISMVKQLRLKVDDTRLFSADIKDVCLSVHPTRHHGVALHGAQRQLYHKGSD
jgi:hypothetical protein